MSRSARAAAELLPELVAIRSVSGSEDAAADFAASELRAGGLDVERLGNSVLARRAGRPGPRLLLCSHLDTVPAGEGWGGDPWAAHWEGGRLTGLGANDAKASVACLMAAALRLAAGPPPAGEVLFALTACEETDNSGMAAVLRRTGFPDGAVVGEPTGLEVARAQAGLAILRATWRGRGCHAAHAARVPHRNALLAAAAELAALPPCLEIGGRHPLLGASTVVATVLHGGSRHNLVPDKTEAIFDCRLAPPQDAADAAAFLRERLPAAEIAVTSARLAPVETDEAHPLVQAALRCAGRRRAAGSPTMSDMALLRGVPAVKCGPGCSERSHAPGEFVLRDEVVAGEAFYRALVPEALAALAAAEVAR